MAIWRFLIQYKNCFWNFPPYTAFSIETLEELLSAPSGDPCNYKIDLNTISKENYLLELASKCLKKKIQLFPYSDKEQEWSKSAINQDIQYKFGEEFEGKTLNLFCSRLAGSGNFYMSIFPINENVEWL